MSRILLIDDEEAILRVMSMSLRSDGHDVMTALSGEEGIKVFQEASPDLVLTDIKMPGMDGIGVLKNVKQIQPDAEVIIITGHGDIDNAIEALKFGASDFINKPVRDDVLTVAIERAEEKRTIKSQLKDYTENLEQKVRLATEEVRRKSNFLTKLIRSSNDGIIATDHGLNVVIYNAGAMRIFGYKRKEVVRRMKIIDLLPDKITSVFLQPPPAPGPGAELARQELTVTAKDKTEIPVLIFATPLYEKQEMVGTVCFFQDLREIKRLEGELIHAERLAAIGQTVAGVAHGVKNILHGFKGGSYLVNLGISKNETEKLNKGWDMIQRNIGRTSDLVLDLLSYSKERTPELKECRPNTIIEDVCDVMHELAKEQQVQLTMQLDPSIGTVVMDPRAIHQCVANLISNAIDACLFDENTDKHWRVHIESALEASNRIRIEVSDNGAGMSEAVQAKLFTSFFTTKGHRGTGLGLLVTHKSVEENGGTIRVASELGAGTTFTLQWPFRDVEDIKNEGG
ncbi:MAG: response regulator [Desulfobacteraceae bacterium]|jgi:PAS domain S-box-containing protein